MSILMLSRIQFFLTTVFHYFFVPLTIGLALFVAVFQTLGYIKNDDRYQKLSEFYGKLFVINFAVGVVTGIVQEFQFGMNWAGYSRFVGDIFGAPLAIEALVAFFLESTFIGVWMFGRGKISPKMHVISIWLVAIGSSLSALWILIANSFMQSPTGYEIVNGRAEMTDFGAIVANQHVFAQFTHVITAAIVTAAFFVIGTSAYKLLKNQNKEIFLKSFRFAVVVGFIGVFAVAGTGDMQGKLLMKEQPMKMAAAEALWETEQPADFAVVALIDEENQENTFEIKVPKLLSFLAFGDFNSEVKGIRELQAEFEKELGEGNYIPPVTVSFWSFRFMIGVAGLMVLLCLILFLNWKNNKFAESKLLMKLAVAALFLPYISNTSGWILTEIGRQPWIVYKLLTVDQAVSANVAPGWVLFSIIGFLVIYSAATVAEIVLITRVLKQEQKEVLS